MSKKSLQEVVREMELAEFPEFSEGEIITPENSEMYFSPSHHVNKGLIDEEVIRDLRDNEKFALTLGCGGAYFEQLLVKRFGVLPAQIELVDINARNIPTRFRFYSFDITEKWPRLDKTYDYVLIPESFTCLNKYKREGYGDSQEIAACYDLLVRSLSVLNINGQIRGDGHCYALEELEALKNRMQNCPLPNSFQGTPKLLTVKKTLS
ncbi:MAG TPA: class I SAM-dependent methyltransferase [Candidatus Nanoarchaeia archaeon]|nr:class I SAM-dependent methyltransferase [Candidatus Nanoarchaeia archaeon]